MLWCRGVEVGLFIFVKLQGKKIISFYKALRYS